MPHLTASCLSDLTFHNAGQRKKDPSLNRDLRQLQFNFSWVQNLEELI